MIYVYYEYMSYGYPITTAVYYTKPIKHRFHRFIALRYITRDVLKRKVMSDDVQINYIVYQDGSLWNNTNMRSKSNSIFKDAN